VNFAQIKGYDLKYRFSLLFGIIALILSIIIGLFAGNDIGIVFIRALVMTIAFMVLGYGIVFIVQKFVPEMLGVVRSDELIREDNVQVDSEAVVSEIMSDEVVHEDVSEGGEDESVPLVDSTLKKDYFNIGEEERKLGKHIVVDESTIKYEPKIMADAIRTMLKRDEK
jgi:hypothetical protein